MMEATFITWYPSCRRSDALAKALNGTSHLIHYLGFKQPLYAPFKYVAQTIASWRCLLTERPDLILVASPPVFAVLAVWLYSRLFRVPYIIDAHTGLFDDPRWTWLTPLNRALARHAVTTIVTNDHLQQEVEKWGARAMVVGDVPVDFPDIAPFDLGSGSNVVVINTFSQDEPLDEVLLAAKLLPDISFHITGNLKHARAHWSASLPPNARFTGWLSDYDYTALLRGADVVMCLTTHDHTMQRGAYEAMALQKPLITSNWDILRETFNDGTIHVDNSSQEIARAVKRAINNSSSMTEEMRKLGKERLQVFEDSMRELRASIKQADRAV